MDIREELGRRIIFFDGGLGSLLQERGLKPGELPETWNLTRPEVLYDIHRAYLDAGADIILANTFGANGFKYDNLEEIVTAAVVNAKKAVADSGRKAYVALDMGPTGKLLKPMGTLDFEECVSIYADVVRYGAKAGADLILIETMSDTYELKAAVLAAKENSNLPVVAAVVFVIWLIFFCARRIREHLKGRELDAMEGHDFEYFCADLLEDHGFKSVEVTRGSGDYGVDVLAEKEGVTYAVQCKRYDGPVGVKAVQEAYAGRDYYDRMVGVVMTNQYFTEPAVKAAKKLKILLWDRGYLESMMEEEE